MKSVAIFCGSQAGRQETYRQAAEDLVDALMERGVSIVYGGGNVGLMGIVADRAMAKGGHVIGVIPNALVEMERAHNGISELIHVDNMSDRKQKMCELADSFITLSGGTGSMDELFQELTHRQVGYHSKTCAILNTGGYYNHLLAWLQNAVDEGFIDKARYDQLIVEASPEDLISRMMESKQ
ncbi:TIGR00730 family Rossman fold protein [Endozoicomonas ascidiicola]|uniref:LOG family protein n=1 Tax=Endozoicomonas ascidiicola TaxID=1698521 RepID=UPI00082E5848|nr:TIGR00730 family Rossman fold protein [Endozoicomonas ascidiicola]